MSPNCNTSVTGGLRIDCKKPFKSLSSKGFMVLGRVGQGLPLLTMEIVGSKRLQRSKRAYVGMTKLCEPLLAGLSGNSEAIKKARKRLVILHRLPIPLDAIRIYLRLPERNCLRRSLFVFPNTSEGWPSSSTRP